MINFIYMNEVRDGILLQRHRYSHGGRFVVFFRWDKAETNVCSYGYEAGTAVVALSEEISAGGT